MFKKKTTPADATRVSFRLDAEAAAELARKATEEGQGHNILARELMLAGLTRPSEDAYDLDLLRVDIANIRVQLEQVRKLRGDFATAINLLLVKAGQLSIDQAEAWVRRELLDPFDDDE